MQNYNREPAEYNQQQSHQSFTGHPTFRAKGVVDNISTIKNEQGGKNMFVADVHIGKYNYNFPVCRNTKVGDVLVIQIDVINVNKNRNQ